MSYGDGKSIIEIVNIGFEPLLTDEEYELYLKIGALDKVINQCENTISFIQSKIHYLDDEECYYIWLKEQYFQFQKKYIDTKEKRKTVHDIFKQMLKDNIGMIRTLCDTRDFKSADQFRLINIFESDLSRCFGCEDMQHSDDIISVVTYFTEIFNSIEHNGFNYKDKHFIFFTAGAGQTRNKKSTFVNEDLFLIHKNRLFCGLTEEMINNLGGMNTNKYLAYTSLCQSNTSIWENFDIDRAIVVPDIEFEIEDQEVRYIYTETPEDKEEIFNYKNRLDEISIRLRELKQEPANGKIRDKDIIEEEKTLKIRKKEIIQSINDIRKKYHKTSIKKMSVKIPYTDGFGIMFKREPNSMIRMPFMKGLLSYVPKSKFKLYCKDNNIIINKIVDIYGKEYNIDDLDYIFTESQFKMHKYYQTVFDDNGEVIKTGWEVYKENFKKYGCTANRCNIEGKTVKLNAKTNYQILQTLTTEMTDDDIKQLAEYDIDNLNGIGNDLQCMLNLLGANEEKNVNLNNFQKSLILYPELFKEYHVKTLLKNTKDSMLKKMRSGKFNINGAYTFIIPEPLVCLQWWFNNERDLNKLGLLKEGEVYCKLFDNNEEVDCLRSPHLDHAHCIRKNTVTDELKSWYKTNGVYIGVNDIMSKLLMYDNDGDKSLVHNHCSIIKCAKQYQKKYKMIPNYYDMPKANPQMISNDTLFDGITNAYHHGNIGTPSNEITKIFDTLGLDSPKDEVEQAIEVIALRCCDVNYVIDYAKTLYKPDIPKEIKEKYKRYSGRKVPYFFLYAKDKKKSQVQDISENNINRIGSVVKPGKIVFKDPKVLGESRYSYKTLMNNADIEYTDEQKEQILSLYREYDTVKLRQLRNLNLDDSEARDKEKNKMFLEKDAIMQREKFVKLLGMDKEFVCDVLIKELQDEVNKDSLWKLFGDVIYHNLEINLKGTKRCECCGVRFNANNNKAKYCDSCADIIKAQQKKKWDKENKNKK